MFAPTLITHAGPGWIQELVRVGKARNSSSGKPTHAAARTRVVRSPNLVQGPEEAQATLDHPLPARAPEPRWAALH